jgi:hypothetical protein
VIDNTAVDAIGKPWAEKIAAIQVEYEAALAAGDEARVWKLALVKDALFTAWKRDLAEAAAP